MNIFDILITLLLIAGVAPAVIHIVKGRAAGACSCGECGSCAERGCCERRATGRGQRKAS